MSKTVNNLKAIGNGLTVFSGDRSADMGITVTAWGSEGIGLALLALLCFLMLLEIRVSAGSGNRCSNPVLPGMYCIHPSQCPVFSRLFLPCTQHGDSTKCVLWGSHC